jgi:hypothetical protein
MNDPIVTAYAAPKSDSAGASDPLEREARLAVLLAVGFLIGTEVIEVGRWLVRVLPMWTLDPDFLRVFVVWFLPRVAAAVSVVYLLRGRRGVVWLPIALACWRELRHVGAPISIHMSVVAWAILVLYVGILLVLTSKRRGRTRIGASVVAIAAYLVLIVIQWFNPIIIYLPRPGSG